MRVFIALPLSPNLTNKILRWQMNNSEFSVRWLSAKNLHITVVPPWETDDIAPIIEVMKNVVIKFDHVDIAISQICFGPNEKNPYMIWAKGETPQVLINLKKELQKSLNQKPEKRDFRLHVTMARFHPEDFNKFSQKSLNQEINWSATLNSIVLMKSNSTSIGAEYEVLGKVMFKN